MSPKLSPFVAGLLVALTITPASAAQHSSKKIDLAVQQALRAGQRTQRVIITVAPAMRTEIRDALKKHGDVIKSDHPSASAIAAEIHSEDIQVLANHPAVRSISIDAVVTASASAKASKNAFGANDWIRSTLRETLGLPRTAIGSPYTGAGVTVALIDSGLATSLDLPANRVKAFFDHTHGGALAAPFDDYGHGTHIAGLIGASGLASDFELQGIAPATSFVVFKVLNAQGQGNTSDVLAAIDHAIEVKDTYGIKVINLSLGHPIFEQAAGDPLVQAVERATEAGIVVVVSAGNFGINPKTGQPGYGGITSPGNAPSAITVGATNTADTIRREDDVVANYSSRGPTWFDAYTKPDVVAPGTGLDSDINPLSLLYKEMTSSVKKAPNGKSFLQLSGTSMAAGVTTGVVALAVQAKDRNPFDGPALTPNAVKAIIEYSAIPLKTKHGQLEYDYLTQGAGQVNAVGAIVLASGINTNVSVDAQWSSPVPAMTTLVEDRKLHTYAWSQNIVWGDRVLTGSFLTMNLAAWGDNIVWGDAASDNIVWGDAISSSIARVAADNIVWGDNIIWGSNIVWGDRLIGMMVGDNIVWGDVAGFDNIVWGDLAFDNIVWGDLFDDNIVWGNGLVF